MNQTTGSPGVSPLSEASGYDPIGDRVRATVRVTTETLFEEEPAGFPGRTRYGRGDEKTRG